MAVKPFEATTLQPPLNNNAMVNFGESTNLRTDTDMATINKANIVAEGLQSIKNFNAFRDEILGSHSAAT